MISSDLATTAVESGGLVALSEMFPLIAGLCELLTSDSDLETSQSRRPY